MKAEFYPSNNYITREIWVLRDENIIELKIWFIFVFEFLGVSKNKILSFLNKENRRFDWERRFSPESNLETYKHFQNLFYQGSDLPPRLLGLSEKELNNLKTELFKDRNGFVYGDSVGGISPNKSKSHNIQLKNTIHKFDRILFNPGVLARIKLQAESSTCYIFQLAEKNLRKKQEVFYKPFGGHLKFQPNKIKYLTNNFDIEIIERGQGQDLKDVSLYIKVSDFYSFYDLFKKDLITNKSFLYFQNPKIAMFEELYEEIGPKESSDGINLLNEQDLITGII